MNITRYFLSSNRFAVLLGIAVGGFAAFELTFPLITYTIAMASNCRGTGGACGAIALVTGAVLKPVSVLILVGALSLLGVLRARRLSFPSWVGAVPALLIGANWMELSVFGAHWGYAMSVGAISPMMPLHAIAGLVMLLAFAILPDQAATLMRWNPLKPIAIVTALALVVLLLTGLARILTPYPDRLLLISQQAAFWIFLLSAAPLTLLARRMDVSGTKQASGDGGFDKLQAYVSGSFAPVPWGWLALLSFVAACLAIGLVIASPLVLFAFPLLFPTTALYFFIAVATYLILRRPNLVTAGIFLVAMLPLAHWGYYRYQTECREHWLSAKDAGLATTHPASPPDAMLVKGRVHLSDPLALPGIRSAYVTSQKGFRVAHADEALGKVLETEAAALPSDYLIFRSGNDSKYKGLGGGGTGPFELSLMHDGTEELIALQYMSTERSVADVPIIGPMGWLQRNNVEKYDDQQPTANAFLLKAMTALRP